MPQGLNVKPRMVQVPLPDLLAWRYQLHDLMREVSLPYEAEDALEAIIEAIDAQLFPTVRHG